MYHGLFYKLLSQKSNLKIMILKEEFFLFLKTCTTEIKAQ